MKEQEVLTLAFAALTHIQDNYMELPDIAEKALNAIEEALEQPEPEPVIDHSAAVRIATALGWEPKREWVGLTEVEIVGLTCECVDDGTFNINCAIDFAHAIEDSLKQKNSYTEENT